MRTGLVQESLGEKPGFVTKGHVRSFAPFGATPIHRISTTGALQDLSISEVVEPSTKLRILEWP